MNRRRPLFSLRGIFRRGSGRDRRPVCESRLRRGPNVLELAQLDRAIRQEQAVLDRNWLRTQGVLPGPRPDAVRPAAQMAMVARFRQAMHDGLAARRTREVMGR